MQESIAMISGHIKKEQNTPNASYTPMPPSVIYEELHHRNTHREDIRAALALLLGPETEYSLRTRAARKIARQGASVLPLLLTTLSHYPEITSPPWPWWPPQYEHCSRLLVHFSQCTHQSLAAFLHHPALTQPAGPVLWTSVIEAAGLVSSADSEELFCQGIATPWATTRYAAAMALASKASKDVLQSTTLTLLRTHQDTCEVLPVRLTSAYALLSSGDNSGLEVLIELLNPHAHEEARKAATFILATEISIPPSASLRERLMHDLLLLLRDLNNEIALLAARALRHIAQPSALSAIRDILEQDDSEMQIRALTALEEIMGRVNMRRSTQQQAFPALIAPLLRSELAEVRRQANYTLAAIGGEYALAVLGTITLNDEHPGHIEAIEGLRLLHNALRSPTRETVLRWLLCTLQKGAEKSQVAALDSLAYLLWQARSRRQKHIWQKMSYAIMENGIIVALLYASSPWVRQRTIELVGMLAEHETVTPLVRRCILSLLHTDSDSGVRACVAATCGQTGADWAIPDLIQALLDEDEQVTITALNTLGQLKTYNHAIVFYVVQELARNTTGQQQSCIQQEAQMLLKKWRRSKRSGRQ